MSLFPEELFGEIKTKHCKKCDRLLPISSFGYASGGNYRYYECRECSRKHSKVRKLLREQNPLSNPEHYVCPICKSTYKQSAGKGGEHLKSVWVLDHDHVTGKFRGYICHSCNRGLGIFRDSVDILNSAIEYLKESNVND